MPPATLPTSSIPGLRHRHTTYGAHHINMEGTRPGQGGITTVSQSAMLRSTSVIIHRQSTSDDSGSISGSSTDSRSSIHRERSPSSGSFMDLHDPDISNSTGGTQLLHLKLQSWNGQRFLPSVPTHKVFTYASDKV